MRVFVFWGQHLSLSLVVVLSGQLSLFHAVGFNHPMADAMEVQE